MLGFGVVALYAVLLRSFSGVLVNAAGAACGLLLSGTSVLPAVSMQRFITPLGWHGDPYLDIHNNFLFTHARYHIYSFFALDCYLYLSWLLCVVIFVLGCFRLGFSWKLKASQSAALLAVLLVCLLAMTRAFAPLWLYVAPLRAVQFPWRLFPATLAVASALVSLIIKDSRRYQRLALGAAASLVLLQVTIPAIGFFACRSTSHFAHALPMKLLLRVPAYAPRSMRETPAYFVLRNFPPEYIPVFAHNAGWHISEDQWSIIPGDHGAVILFS
jgi:hypothetical protein